MKASAKTVAMVMPVRNEERAIAATLDAVFASTRLPDEIVVADGMSTDATIDAIMAYGERGVPIRIVENEGLWAGSGRNRAIEATDCEIIILSDFGNRIEPDYVERVAAAFEADDTLDVVGGLFRVQARTDFEHCVAAIHYFEDYTLDRLPKDELEALVPDVILPGGLCTSFTRRIWSAVGRQPEWLAKGQDKLFSRKVYAYGGKGAIVWEARLWHHVRGSPRALFLQLFLYGRGNGQMRFLSKHVVKLAVIYGVLALLVALSPVSWLFPFAAAILLGAYVWRAGIRKVILVDGQLRSWRLVPVATMVLLVRDIGSLLGHAVGWIEWFLRPSFRRNYRRYMGGLPADRVQLVAPELRGRGLLDQMRRFVGRAT